MKEEAVILVLSAEHQDLIQQRLEMEGFEISKLKKSGQLLLANAEDLLAAFLLEGVIEEHPLRLVSNC